MPIQDQPPVSPSPIGAKTELSADQIHQQNEADQLRQDEIDASRGVEDGDIDEGGGDRGAEPRVETEPEPQQRQEPVRMSPADAARAAISKRFKRDDEGTVPFNGDMTDPEMLYGKVARQEPEEPEESEEPAAAAQPAPKPAQAGTERMHTIMVRGKPETITETELLRRAQMVTAADQYLEESRQLLEAAKTVRAEGSARHPQHPEGHQAAADDRTDQDEDRGRQHPGNLEAIVEEIQFGEPKKAAALLADAIDQRADKKADDRQLTRLVNKDKANAQKALKAFSDANPDLRDDEMAAQLTEATIYKIYREDIEKLGVVDPAQIPKDPRDLAEWHRFYRVSGDYDVMPVEKILDEAGRRVRAFKGGNAGSPQPAAQKKAPRIEVSVQRSERRAAIPQQPSRSAAPRPNPTPSSGGVTDRSATIARMKASRGQLVS